MTLRLGDIDFFDLATSNFGTDNVGEGDRLGEPAIVSIVRHACDLERRVPPDQIGAKYPAGLYMGLSCPIIGLG